MSNNFSPATPRFPQILYGGDYNPEQWLDRPDILEKDIELFKKANINCVTLGVFSWSSLEPQKDVFTFDWLENVINNLYENGIRTILATPSGSRPQWLAREYPEVLRTGENGQRNFYGHRHNHCYTSPAYRERVKIIDTKLAERFASNPAVILWHISNEFGGDCHCELCQEAFREYLKKRYGSLEELNKKWWAHFWSHTYTDWSQIHSPGYRGGNLTNGLFLDWRRFVTERTTDFMKWEIAAVKAVNPEIPVTANLMGIYCNFLDYFKLGKELDVVSWDSYPEWHAQGGNRDIARNESLSHDMMRSVKQRSFLLMECTVSTTNWRPISKLKKPGMHRLSVLNAIAHGADSSLCFQMRQGRGSSEKFHSGIISHIGTENTRVFQEVASLGAELDTVSDKIYSSDYPAETAIIYDAENDWALNFSQGPRNAGMDYFGAIQTCYDYFWQNGINTDIISCDYSFEKYKLVVAPMLYMFRSGIAEKLREFVRSGGTLITTCFGGVVDENDLCLLGEATEEKLSDVLGLWVEEIDALYDGEYNSAEYNGKRYELKNLCEIIRPTTCKTVSVYEKDFYKGSPVITENVFGAGKAYHIGSCAGTDFYNDFFGRIAGGLKLEMAMNIDVPQNVSLSYRVKDNVKYIFVQNFGDTYAEIPLDKEYYVLSEGQKVADKLTLKEYDCAVLCDNLQ